MPGNLEAQDLFGSALVSGNFDNDGFGDLAVGVPDEAIGSDRFAGAVSWPCPSPPLDNRAERGIGAGGLLPVVVTSTQGIRTVRLG